MPSPITLSCPLPSSDLFFAAMTAVQGLSLLDEFELELLSEKPDLEPEKLLGQNMDVAVALPDGGTRHFNGVVMRFGIAPSQGRYYAYRASVRPWLWFLTRTADCKVFQDLSVPDIVEQVFGDHTVANFKFSLDRSYRKRVYCVQYRETDFNFVARLLEEEGIYWYFEHSDGAHKLILVDDPSHHETAPTCEALPFYGNQGQVPPEMDYIGSWSFSREVRTGQVASTSYDFERPSVTLAVDEAQPREHELSDYEQFDFQGEYTVKEDGSQLVRNRVDELQSSHERLSGSTNAHGLAVGWRFALTRHAREDQNAEYLCTQSRIIARVNGHESGNLVGDYMCSFGAVPAGQVFRPKRRTPKPFVQGPQTAVVVGPSGEEIFTDKYGRVKVQFHWDRYGQRNEKSSCWVRVSAPWAGKSFGFMQVPRMTQEVVVDFLEGDPDQPLITGRVYNAEQMPPWDLPANATQSGVLSRSSKGGAYGNANALRFEDKKGDEELWLHAEKNQLIEVENDEVHWVGHDRKKTVDNDENVRIKNNRTEKVDVNEDITIGVNRTENVGAEERITIGANRTEEVGGDEKIEVKGSRTEKVGADESIQIGASQALKVASSQEITVGASRTDSVTAGVTQTIGGTLNQTVTGGINITTPAAVTIMAAGGFTVIAPGGTKTIDSFFSKIGLKTEDIFAMKTNILSIKTDIGAMSLGAWAMKAETVGLSIKSAGIEIKNTPLTATQAATKMKMGALGLYMYGITLLN